MVVDIAANLLPLSLTALLAVLRDIVVLDIAAAAVELETVVVLQTAVAFVQVADEIHVAVSEFVGIVVAETLLLVADPIYTVLEVAVVAAFELADIAGAPLF